MTAPQILPDARDNDALDIVRFLIVLRRQLRLILVSALVVVVFALVYVTRATPVYTATALIRIDPEERNLLDPSLSSAGGNASLDSTRIETEVEILKSDQLLLQTIETLSLFETPEFSPQLSYLERAKAALGMDPGPMRTGAQLLRSTLSTLRKSVVIRRRGLTYIVSVQATSPSQEQAAQIANAHAQTYIDDQMQARLGGVLAARDILTSQLEAAQGRLTSSNAALGSYIEDNVLELARDSGDPELARIGRELQATTGNLTRLQDLQDSARLARDAEDWTRLAGTLEDAALAALEGQRQALRQRLEQSASDGPERFDLQASLDALDAQLRSQSDQALRAVDTRLQSSRDTRLTLLDAAQAQLAAVALSAGALSDIYALQQEAGIAQRQYDQLLARLRELETQASLQLPSSRIVSTALVPTRPSAPNAKLILTLAAFVGAALGVGLALLKEFAFGGITSALQLANVVGAPVGAAIPQVKSGGAGQGVADQVHAAPMSRFSEELRKLRAAVDLRLRARQGADGACVLVTSALPSEGKSTVALSLARTYAAAGRRVLLIDCDLRNPSLHKLLGRAPEVGLMDHLLEAQGAQVGQRDASDPSAFYVDDPKSGAYVILGRRLSDVPTDAPIQSHALSTLLATARGSFDLVIVDSAPILPVVDTRYLASEADLTVLCVRFAQTSQTELRAAVSVLNDTMRPEAPMVTVLNGADGDAAPSAYDAYYG